MKIIGLTGSIAMGKSTAATMFVELGVPLHDSDATVHEFYQTDAAPLLAPHFPDAIVDGKVDRGKLSGYVINNKENMQRLESLVHPFVEASRNSFVARQRQSGAAIVVVDIPLLFEIGGVDLVDIIAVVSAGEDTQRQRALARPNMTVEKFEAIKAKQLPDAQKRAQAHYVISSEHGFDATRSQIRSLLRALS
ncbi:MAG: dephospho-CoA kinase [Hyphomicrobiales bacterium]|nr:dephospho-CoA kinase [Hyphomicrobiales bacterium]